MRVLVTGHAGFIGQHLGRELQEAGHVVYGHDLRDGDLAEPGVLTRALDEAKPDRVIHLAAQVGRLFGEDDLIHTIQANATLTTLLAHATGERGIPVLYASSSEVYGDQGERTCIEGGQMVLPHNLYGLTKRWGEEALRLYNPDGLKVARLSMPYGPGAPPGRGRRAMDNFLWQAHHRQPIPVHRGAERSWCWVGDTVRGLRMILESDEAGVFNVGRDDQPLSMLQLAQRCCELADAPADLVREIEPPGRQTVVKRLDTQRLRSLGWRPGVELDEGLPRLYDWIRRFDRDGNYAEPVAA